jgi:hypothetical protein
MTPHFQLAENAMAEFTSDEAFKLHRRASGLNDGNLLGTFGGWKAKRRNLRLDEALKLHRTGIRIK